MSEAKANWRTLGVMGVNYVLDGDGFYISYAPNPGMGLSLFSSDDGGDETALVKNNVFYILNGDYRSDYEAIINEGFDKCLEFYKEQKEKHGSSWSDD